MIRVTTISATAVLGVIAVLSATASPFENRPTNESPSNINTQDNDRSEPLASVGHPTFVSPHTSPIAIHGGHIFVANTPSDTLDVIDANSRSILARVKVGIDPVSVAIRPDGKEVWVSNHVSDSVSVIDNDRSSVTYLHVIATVQDFNATTKATRFDEPVGIAFASNDKAYVALSAENAIAVIDVATRKIRKRLTINAQDPRAIVVRGNRLYAIPFESNNKTQLSGGAADKIDGDLVTFDAWDHSITNNNVLSLGHVTDIVKHPRVPDRDLFVFDTKTDELLETVDSLGTLLYGMTVDSRGRVFVAQTDARNDINGRAGTKKHSLVELENRAFLNRITRVTPATEILTAADASRAQSAEPHTSISASRNAPTVNFFDLEPLPPNHPEPGSALATPFAIEVSDDDTMLVVSAAASDKLFTVDSDSGQVLGRVDVGAVPRGIALQNAANGQPLQAWVLNAVANTVSLVDLSNAASPAVVDTITLEDPTHPVVKRGRIAFESATASTTGTYSCASCHPDGHTDQLLWVLKTPIVTGGNQIMPRSTMPIRGIRDTEPYHWDGIPGDPYGGNNSHNVHGSDRPNTNLDHPTNPARHLIDAGLAATMSLEGDTTVNDEGKAGRLSAAQRDAMATFLLSVPYPPAQRRAYTNVVSDRAKSGFRLFHIDGDLDPTKPKPNVCGDCHRMPFLVSTNTPGTGMDAPTWRGAYDRFLILPQGRLNIIDFDFYARVAERGQPERDIWQFSWAGRRRFDPVWDMVLEGSTGFSGSFARQLTLSNSTLDANLTLDLLNALEISAAEGAIVLEGEGVLLPLAATETAHGKSLALQYLVSGRYVNKDNPKESFSRSDLIAMAAEGRFTGTFTARHGAQADFDHPQPAIWTKGPIERQRGSQQFPVLHQNQHRMIVSSRHIAPEAFIIIDGRRVQGMVTLVNKEQVEIELESLPAVGMHLLQLQNPSGLFSNDFIFQVHESPAAASARKASADPESERRAALRAKLAELVINGRLTAAESADVFRTTFPEDDPWNAVHNANQNRLQYLVEHGADVNERNHRDGSTLMSAAAFHGHAQIVKYLLDQGADVNASNADGNTPLHVAAFLCREDIVQLLLDHGASLTAKSHRGETPLDVVRTPWSDELAAFYRTLGEAGGFETDTAHVRKSRPEILQLLQSQTQK